MWAASRAPGGLLGDSTVQPATTSNAQVLVEPRVAITVSQRGLTVSASADSITALSILEHGGAIYSGIPL